MSTPRLLYEFEGFRVDAGQRLLYASQSTAPLEIPPRAFDALLYMVERPGELLTKADLFKALWPGVIVEENSLNQLVSLLRRVLGERPSEHRYIVTAPGRGYRFVAAVRASGPDAQDPAQSDEQSIAILPFANLAPTQDGGYLGDAIAVDLIRSLSSHSRVRVASHTSSFAFRGTPVDVRAVARTLNVRYVLEGHVAQSGTRLVVSARLIEGHSGLQRWATESSCVPADVAMLQQQLAREVHQAVDPAAPAAPPARTHFDPDAWRDYLMALAHTMKPSVDSAQTSIALLRSAVSKDPQFARAKSLLAIQYTTCVMFGFPPQDALDRARHEVADALAIDETNGETHCAAGVIDCLGGAWCRGEERFRVAHSLSADPLISGLRCAYLSLSVGHLQRALQQAEHALRVAPTHPIGAHMLAMLHHVMGDDLQAQRYADLVMQLGQPRTVAPLADILTQLRLRAGQRQEATDLVRALLPARLHLAPQIVAGLCRDADAMPLAAAQLRALERAMTPVELDPLMRKRLMLWYAGVGELDAAYDLAGRSLDLYEREGTIGGAWGVLWLPEMAPFRADARFSAFARRLRFLEYWSEYGPPDGYSLRGDGLRGAIS